MLVRGVETETLHQKAQRPLNAGMWSVNLPEIEKKKLMGVKEGLAAMKETMSE
jgi:hypothetical protein